MELQKSTEIVPGTQILRTRVGPPPPPSTWRGHGYDSVSVREAVPASPPRSSVRSAESVGPGAGGGSPSTYEAQRAAFYGSAPPVAHRRLPTTTTYWVGDMVVRGGKRAFAGPVRNTTWVCRRARMSACSGARDGPPLAQARFETDRTAALSPFGAKCLSGAGVSDVLHREAGAGAERPESTNGGPAGACDVSVVSGGAGSEAQFLRRGPPPGAPSSGSCRSPSAVGDDCGRGGRRSSCCSSVAPAFMRETTSAPEPPPTHRAVREAASNASSGVAALLSMHGAGGATPAQPPPLARGRGGTSVPAFERRLVEAREELRVAREKWSPAQQGLLVSRELVTCE